jgi:uncharacterized C2H2 Zn-finger protein
VWGSPNLSTGKDECEVVGALDKMGAHIAACHLRSEWFRCSSCDKLYADRKKYGAHFDKCDEYLRPDVSVEGPSQKRARLQEPAVDVPAKQ